MVYIPAASMKNDLSKGKETGTVKGLGLYKAIIELHERFIQAIREMEKQLMEEGERKEDNKEHKGEQIQEKEKEQKEAPAEEKTEKRKEAPTEERTEVDKAEQKVEMRPVETEIGFGEKTDKKAEAGNPEMIDKPPPEEGQQESFSFQLLLEKLNEAAERIRGHGSHGLEIVMSEGLFGQTLQMELPPEKEGPSIDHEPHLQSREIRSGQADAGGTAPKERETYILTGREVCRLLEEIAAKIANQTLAVGGKRIDIPLDENLAYTVKYEDSSFEGKLSITLSWIKGETIH